MANSIKESASTQGRTTQLVKPNAGQEDDYDISLGLFCDLEERKKLKADDEHRRRIGELKEANKKLHRSSIAPVFIENFDDLFFERGKIDEIIASKGKVKIGKMLYDPESVGHILTYVFGRLLQGAPGDSGPKVLKKNADKFAIDIASKIAEIRQKAGFTTYRQIASELTRQKVTTSRGQGKDIEWHPSTVRNLELRIEKLKKSGKLSI